MSGRTPSDAEAVQCTVLEAGSRWGNCTTLKVCIRLGGVAGGNPAEHLGIILSLTAATSPELSWRCEQPAGKE